MYAIPTSAWPIPAPDNNKPQGLNPGEGDCRQTHRGNMRRRSDSAAAGEPGRSRTRLFLFVRSPTTTVLLFRRDGCLNQCVENLIQGSIF